MIKIVEMHPTRCAICGTEGNTIELYPANIDQQAFNPIVFSARRLPDRIHYCIVKCNTCGLVRSDPISAPEVLMRLYAHSSFDYADEIENLKLTYGRYLAKLSGYGGQRGALLEIGCGNGFFLEEAFVQGYTIVRGVEPSVEAVAKANPQVRSHIVCGIMRPGLFEAEQFNVICLFQVLDHIPNPGALLDECFRILEAGGLMLCVNHNVGAVSARVLKDRSPIIDIEHTYLYSPTTISRLFVAHGFQVKHVGSVFNTYTLYYLTRLVPLASGIKRVLLTLLKNTPIGGFRLSVPLGNLCLIAKKQKKHIISTITQN